MERKRHGTPLRGLPDYLSDNDHSPPAKRTHYENDANSNSDSDVVFESDSDSLVSNENEDMDSIQSLTKWDKFCWKCDKKNEDNVRCSGCDISFHLHCTNDIECTEDGWKCPECDKIDDHSEEERAIFNGRLGGFLKCVIERIVRQHKFEIPGDYANSPLLVNPVKISDIIDKVKNEQYISTDAFLLDFKWLRHNCAILNNENKDRGTDEKKQLMQAQKDAKRLMNECTNNISDLKACPDCYLNLDEQNPIRLLCKKPHVLLWAQYGGHPYWPAKLLKITSPKQVEVRFFGDNTSALVPSTNCMLYSNEDPNEWISDRKRQIFNEAVFDAYGHITSIRQKFGAFHFAPVKTPLVLANIEQHLDDMIPGYRDPSKRVNTSAENDGDATTSSATTNAANLPGNELLQQGEKRSNNRSTPCVAIKQERINDYQSVVESNEGNDELNKSTSSTVNLSNTSSVLECIPDATTLQKENDSLNHMVEQYRVQIETLKAELQQKSDDLVKQRERFVRHFQEYKAEMVSKCDEIKKKQWCAECKESFECENPPVCGICCLFK